jgi:tetratricopeptide (TPR) repeat protein
MDFLASTIDRDVLHKLTLPPAPESEVEEVKAWEEPVEMLTYPPASADLNPMFLEKRVYQGSSGGVYPLPFIDRIATEPVVRAWQAIHLENQFIRLMILPEIGGRIHVGLDKTNGYDFFYRQNVIKPALVGLAGPWVSGGVEFNWPQHHRPATFMPVETEIERHQDGSVTVWCSDYDPASGMKGMHGVCLHPDWAIVELKARLYNGTESVQTFLWWANAAAKVHQNYQSFFPPDVTHVADHAKRAISSFPLAKGSYYGVNYAERAVSGVPEDEAPERFKPCALQANDLSRYANIPVPTSYMIVDTQGDFFGGYDHAANAGFVHIANHHIAPGKKQWTWGNHSFGYAWDRCLTHEDGPYVELMAGVYTDNQPDFSYLAPGETKTFRQYWYPLRNCGVPQAANLDAAVRLEAGDGLAHISICVTRELHEATVSLRSAGKMLAEWEQDLFVESGFEGTVPLPVDCDATQLTLELWTGSGRPLTYSLAEQPEKPAPCTAVEPEPPESMPSVEDLFLTGLHLQQYRHATRSPEPYWREAVKRDASDMRSNHALAKLHLMRGEYALAESHIRTAIARGTRLNGNPYDGEVFYTLGLVLRRLGRFDDAYAAFYKSTWNLAWRAAGYHALGEIDAMRGELEQGIEHLQLSLRTNTDNLNARNLCAMLLRQAGREDAAIDLLADTSDLDPLDLWSRYLDSADLPKQARLLLSLGVLMERGGQLEAAIDVFTQGVAAPDDGYAPLLHIAIASCHAALGNDALAERHMTAAEDASPHYCFPSSLDHLDLLQYAIKLRPNSARFHYYLGNLLYHFRRHGEAILHWETATSLDASYPQAWRNLAMGYFNIRRNSEAALRAFEKARACAKQDARLLYESDQLQKRLKFPAQRRLLELLRQRTLVESRDDLTVELAALFNQLNRPQEALDVLLSRQFQPWEGGEGLVLSQFTAAEIGLGRAALHRGCPQEALRHFNCALNPPPSLGEARHLLANISNIHYWLGRACEAMGDEAESARNYRRSARQHTDFQGMAVEPFSEMTYWSGLSMQRLGQAREAHELFEALLTYGKELEQQKAKIDYFATSLPTLLLFEDDLDERQKIRAIVMQAAALTGLGATEEARELLDWIAMADPNNLFVLGLAEGENARDHAI